MQIDGGAGTITRNSMTPEMEKACVDTLTIALRRGYDILSRGGSSPELTSQNSKSELQQNGCEV